MPTNKVSGLNIIGVKSENANPLADIISQIQSGAIGGYSSGQALGLDMLKMMPKPVSALQTAQTNYLNKKAGVVDTTKTKPETPSQTIAKLNVKLRTVQYEMNNHIRSMKTIQSNIDKLQTAKQKPLAMPFPELTVTPNNIENIYKQKIEDLGYKKDSTEAKQINRGLQQQMMFDSRIASEQRKLFSPQHKLSILQKQYDELQQSLNLSSEPTDITGETIALTSDEELDRLLNQ